MYPSRQSETCAGIDVDFLNNLMMNELNLEPTLATVYETELGSHLLPAPCRLKRLVAARIMLFFRAE